MLNDGRWKVETGGFWRTLWSIVIRDVECSAWLVTNKKTGEEWRLTDEEETFLRDISERVNVVQFAPEFRYRSKTERKKLSQRVLADCLEAIAMKRQGDSSEMEKLARLNQPELTTHGFALWEL